MGRRRTPVTAPVAEATPVVQPTVQGKTVLLSDLVTWVKKPYYRVEDGKTIKLDANGRQAKRDAMDAVGALLAILKAEEDRRDLPKATTLLLEGVASRREWLNIINGEEILWQRKVQAN